MRQTTGTRKSPVKKVVKDINRKHQRCIRSSAVFDFDLSFLPLNHGLIRPWHQLADTVGGVVFPYD